MADEVRARMEQDQVLVRLRIEIIVRHLIAKRGQYGTDDITEIREHRHPIAVRHIHGQIPRLVASGLVNQ